MSRDSRILIVAEGMLLFVLALWLRLLVLDSPFGGNELFHILAGRSWTEDGTFRVAHGVYERNSEFTILISYLVRTFGETPFVARMPAVIAGSLTVSALFIWMRLAVSRRAAWFAAVLLGVCPLAIEMSQWVRVYTLYGFCFFLGAIGIYALVTQKLEPLRAGVIAILSVGFLWLSVRLHFVSQVGVAGLALWVLIIRRQQLTNLARKILQNKWSLALLLLCGAGAIGALFLSGEVEKMLVAFRDIQPQAAERQGDYFFYHRWLLDQYPLLWGAIPLVIGVGIARKPDFALFCTCIFFTVFIVYMFASRKWLRYLYYVMPFLMALWGFALAEALPYLLKFVAAMADKLRIRRDQRLIRNIFSWGIYSLIGLVLLTTNAVLKPIYYQVAGVGSSGTNWVAARETLSPWLLDKNAVVLSSPMQQALFYFDRSDIEFGPKYIYQSDTGQEFGIDRRTGLPAISMPESMELVFDCYRRGLFVMEGSKWQKSGYGPSDGVLALLKAHAIELAEVRQWGLVAFAWDVSSTVGSDDCGLLAPASGGRNLSEAG